MDVSTASLRVLRSVAERGSFTAAAEDLGYTQSGISRQAAALEKQAGEVLFERQRHGVRLTPAGLTLLRHARVMIDELEAAQREMTESEGVANVRLGAYISAGATLLPTVLATLRRRGDVRVTTREGTTPALVRAVRAGSLDLAVITSRPPHRAPDRESPTLTMEKLAEAELLIAAPAHGTLAGRSAVTLAELAEADWIASPTTGDGNLLGVWPGLPGRPRIAHHARDWLTKLRLVAAGCGITTAPPGLGSNMPAEVILLRVVDGPREVRRVNVIRMHGKPSPAVKTVMAALHAAS